MARTHEANWVVQSERDAGARSDGLSTDDLLQLRWLRREHKHLRTECDTPPRSRLRRDAGRIRCGSRMSAQQHLGATAADGQWGHSNE